MYVFHRIWRICICIRLQKCREYKFETTDAVKRPLAMVDKYKKELGVKTIFSRRERYENNGCRSW